MSLRSLIITTIDRRFRAGSVGIDRTLEIAAIDKIFAAITGHSMQSLEMGNSSLKVSIDGPNPTQQYAPGNNATNESHGLN
jgi:hypothetical protein